ncbi:MAG: DNA polymerase III subunit gamma/tau [Bacilli bacterium]|nr:DNA polymerase III subunit gamma/tau [Bacilli bacterium]
MLYQALYRKYRPKTFDDVCGQKVIVQTLKNTIINNKLTHAYLFIGPRGTGKTSIAKIFAKTINCENTKDGNSCEECDICKLSNNNENIDIIEMDAASNNGVDEIREIKNHVTLMPTFSKYKVYIIDEVHMLSAGAFNALLKTLEEPPRHVIFILATTEPQKVPLTIMSRCQSFEFKSIPVNLMKEKIQYICDQEKIKIDNDALEQICIDSNGGLRDGIGLLDQLNSYTNGNIKKEDVLLLNGRLNEEDINSFINYIYNNEIDKAFNLSDKIDEDGKDYIFVCEDIIKYVKNSLIDYQINNDNELIKKIGKDNAIDIIYQITDYINYIRNIKEKKIYFDLLIIKLLDIFNKTNVRVKESVVSSVKKEKEIKVTTDEVVEKEKIEIKTESPIVDDKKYDNYKELMDIRLNNILRIADKESFKEYMDFFNNLENDLDNLDERKIFNLLLDCSIKAGSKDGIIITASNNNILNELYDNFKEIEDLFINKLSKDIKVCFYKEEEWNKKRSEYVKKIKNKENIDILDETKVLNKINKKDSSEKNEFEDLLEIGE